MYDCLVIGKFVSIYNLDNIFLNFETLLLTNKRSNICQCLIVLSLLVFLLIQENTYNWPDKESPRNLKLSVRMSDSVTCIIDTSVNFCYHVYTCISFGNQGKEIDDSSFVRIILTILTRYLEFLIYCVNSSLQRGGNS